jgi:glycyl-tRNA synthetase
MNPATFLRVLGPEPWDVCYAEPSIRPDDSRYGDNPNRVQRHTQFQVILKPEPGNAQELYLQSLVALGIDVAAHDVRFVEDNWESPVLGAWGLGWEVWLDGMEVTQFTYFQQAGAMPLRPPACEITYGLERIVMSLQGVTHFKDIRYNDTLTYGEAWLQNEVEMSTYALQVADVKSTRARFDAAAAEASHLVTKRLPLPAYDALLRASHAFNILDARGAVGVTERAELFAVMRGAARDVAQLWLARREELGFPLLHSQSAESSEAVETQHAAGSAVTHDGQLPSAPATFVLEIGLEELPAADVSTAAVQLQTAVTNLLAKLRLSTSGPVTVGATPRRLVATVPGLSPAQQPREDTVRGPPAKAAQGADGAWTQAALGFAKKNGVQPADLFLQEDPSQKGSPSYVWARVNEAGRPAADVLSAELPALVGSAFAWPRTMRWGTTAECGGFPRPLRWLVALHGSACIHFSAAGVTSGRETRGLRKPVAPVVHLASADEHASVMASLGVVPDQEQRRRVISHGAGIAAASVGGSVTVDEGLLDEVVNLVEAPRLIAGSYDPKYLALPREVLVTVMRKHQRYFPVSSGAYCDDLRPSFVTAANGDCDEDAVRAGNEAVLRARLEDASFFYAADLQKDLSACRSALSGTVFETRLGSMLAKCERTEKLVQSHLARALRLTDADSAVAVQAAHLSRFDLATSLVQEFTNLAGTMGRHYASRRGVPEAVATAVFEAVLPRSAGDQLPKTPPGIAVAVADRLDALVGLFAVGGAPSATADPFGLRRAAYGAVDALVSTNSRIDLRAAIAAAAALQPVSCTAACQEEVAVFIVRRLEQLLVDRSIASVEQVRAVLAEHGNDPAAAASEAAALALEAAESNREKSARFSAVLAALARPTRLVRSKAAASGIAAAVDPALFSQQEEKDVYAALLAAEAALAAAKTEAHAQGSPVVPAFFAAVQPLTAPIDAFFTNVLVMAEDAAVKGNRLALAQRLATLSTGVLDLSALPGF